MALVRVHMRLTPETVAWLPLVAKGNKGPKGEPDPKTPREWCFLKVREVAIRYGQAVNRLQGKGHLDLRGPGPDSVRLKPSDLKAESFHPRAEADGATFDLEMPPKVAERVYSVVALLHLYIDRKILQDEPFDTLEDWAASYLGDAIADAYTALENEGLGETGLPPEPRPAPEPSEDNGTGRPTG